MSNMATMIMEGASIGSAKLSRHYDHENGATLIAMESAEALNAIFKDVFYTPNSCTITAAMEGVAVEESSQATVMEAALKGAFAKIKQFFINLKEKVKEFLHNIKRYLLGVFGNDEKWVKQYEKELNALTAADLKDYKVKMYKYTLTTALTADALAKEADDLNAEVEKLIEQFKAQSLTKNGDDFDDEVDEIAEKRYKAFLKDLCGKDVDEDEVDKELWSKMRDGADNEKDMDDVDVSSAKSTMIAALKSSTKDVAAYDKCISKTDSMYQKAIKTVDKAQKDFDNLKESGMSGPGGEKPKEEKWGDNNQNTRYYYSGAQTYVSTVLRKMSSTLSKMQSQQNKSWNAAKSALVERNSAYKKALVGAFAYARKNKK
ncbi:MAG: hypothetical protein NC548_28860 [Lachnospiraceae bacterium]|nr:hypothetical protein [Lachnospiraceae bacterium]